MTFNDMLNDLSKYKGNNHSAILAQCIQERLSKSVEVYYKELHNSYIYFKDKDEIQTMKRLNK